MLTAGMLHSTGPFRMYVNFANKLSAEGIASFRFDLSGIGESLPVGSSGSSLERAASETQQAMDFLAENHGIKRFVLMGLCSGADDSFYTAQQDDRVNGVILLDGCGYATSRFARTRFTKHTLPRLTSPSYWFNKIRGMAETKSETPASLKLGDDIREFPSRDQAAVELQQLVDRGVKLNFVYTGGVHWYYNYENQFNEMFSDVDMKDQVSSVFYPNMDHVAFLCEDRKQLLDGLVDWTKENFKSPSSDRGANSESTKTSKAMMPTLDLAPGTSASSSEAF